MWFFIIIIVIHSKYWIKWKHKLRTRKSGLLRKLRHTCFIKSRDLNTSLALPVVIKTKCHNSFTSVLHLNCLKYFIVVCLFLERLDWEVEALFAMNHDFFSLDFRNGVNTSNHRNGVSVLTQYWPKSVYRFTQLWSIPR